MAIRISIWALACALLLLLNLESAAQPFEDADARSDSAQSERPSVPAFDDVDVPLHRGERSRAFRRFLRHITDPDGVDAWGLPLWLLHAEDDVPDRVEAEVQAIREMRTTFRRLSSYSAEEVHIRVMLPRPGWSITIPIR